MTSIMEALTAARDVIQLTIDTRGVDRGGFLLSSLNKVDSALAQIDCADAKEKIDLAAQQLTEWFGYAWSGLDEDRVADKGYKPWCWSGTGQKQFQGGKEDVRDIIRSILSTTVPSPSVSPIEIICRYEHLLRAFEPINEPDPGTSNNHLRWMLKQLRGPMDAGKANRWLGFIQGIMVARGFITVPEEREFTRPFFASPGNGAEKLARLRFFRDLVGAERIKVYKAFDVLPQDYDEPTSLGIESHLFGQLLAALHSTSAAGEATSSDGSKGFPTSSYPDINDAAHSRPGPSEAIPAGVLAMKEACKRAALDAFREQCGCEKHCDSWPASRGFCQCANIEADITRAIDKLSPEVKAADTFQSRVQPWMMTCFGPEISADRIERNHRFLEEALELVQSTGCTQSEAHQLVDYVYGRPAGETHQEIGGVMVTLAALCLALGDDMHKAGDTELARIWTMVEKIRAKQAAKPKHSPLPEVKAEGGRGEPVAIKPLEWDGSKAKCAFGIYSIGRIGNEWTLEFGRTYYDRFTALKTDVAPTFETALDAASAAAQADYEQRIRSALVVHPASQPDVEAIARAICKSRSCEGFSCCQWPAQGGRTNCPVKNGGYNDAARDAIAALLDGGRK